MIKETTLSPRTLGMYFGCRIIIDQSGGELIAINKGPEFYGVNALGQGYMMVKNIGRIRLQLKCPTNDVGAYDVYGADYARSNGFDLGGFVIQDKKEIWVASLIDAGVAVETEKEVSNEQH